MAYTTDKPPKVNERVLMVSGYFRGIEGDVVSVDVTRGVAKVFVNVFGGLDVKPVEIALTDLEPAPINPLT